MRDLARAVLVLFGLLVLAVACIAVSIEGSEPSVPLTEEDVIGTWQGDRGARLEVTADGRARLSDASGWRCFKDGQAGGFTGEGSWIMAQHSDEDPGILVKFTVDGAPATQCSDHFAIHRADTRDGGDVWARWLGTGSKEPYRRTPTG
ncbi:hypothetical protein [Streptomyces sp. NRRL F-4474]|uniref:hypothetical protein n=1 Tax=Streptomyces sp. NRRL F-4474 TaxID=1463851 RepID=UPI0004C98391|nr:hypothetical protein [Streptomyces sp. NRRL F-4474]